MIKKVYGTFKKFINNDNGTRVLEFYKATNDLGDNINNFYIDDAMVIACMSLKFGDRYMIGYGDVEDNIIRKICHTKKVYKNPRCDIFRRFKDEFHIIGGKYQGKKDKDIDRSELIEYCIWLGYNSYNEMTLKNALKLLKKLHDE